MQTPPEVAVPPPTVDTDRTPATTYDPYVGRRSMWIKLTQAVYFIVGLIEVLLVMRLALKA
jgi:hypothetical protein